MPELTPLDNNRQEHFLNGEDLEPITRREHFYAGRESELPAGHQEPETREEWFIQKYRGGGGDVTVVPLSVTDNGTYSEEGKAYSPVSVDVPLPTNAYLLKSVPNLPHAIASFNDGQDMVMPSLKVAIEPQQDLHGYDSPWVGGAGKNKFNPTYLTDIGATLSEGIFTFSAISQLYQVCLISDNQVAFSYDYMSSDSNTNIYLAIVYTDNTVLRDITACTPNVWKHIELVSDSNKTPAFIRLGFYADGSKGGKFKNVQLESGNQATTFAPYSNICPISGWDEVDLTVADDVETPTVSNVYTIDLDGTRYGGEVDVVNGIVTPAPYYASYNGETLTGEWISDRDKYEVGATPTIGAQVVNIGASGTPVSILPTAIKSLRGVNDVYANTGDIKDAEYFSKEV